jgi:hypothetical protein
MFHGSGGLLLVWNTRGKKNGIFWRGMSFRAVEFLSGWGNSIFHVASA